MGGGCSGLGLEILAVRVHQGDLVEGGVAGGCKLFYFCSECRVCLRAQEGCCCEGARDALNASWAFYMVVEMVVLGFEDGVDETGSGRLWCNRRRSLTLGER